MSLRQRMQHIQRQPSTTPATASVMVTQFQLHTERERCSATQRRFPWPFMLASRACRVNAVVSMHLVSEILKTVVTGMKNAE